MDRAALDRLARRTAGVLAVAALAALGLACFPGYASFDVVSQLDQARRGTIDDVAAPAMALLFIASADGSQGTGAVFLVDLLLVAAASLILLRAARAPTWCLALLAAGLPPLLLLLPHAWSDVHLLACLALATALALQRQAAPPGAARLALGIAIIVLLGWATWTRHNAILAAWPLALLLLPARWSRPLWLGGAVLVGLALVAVRALSSLAVDAPRSVWAVTPMWDLQALSIRRDAVLLPEGFVGPGMDVAQLRAAFSPYSAVPLFGGTRSGVRNPTLERLDPVLAERLRGAWFAAVLASPRDWLAHRARVTRGLLGTHRGDDLVRMVDVPSFPPEARRAPWQDALHAHWRGIATSLHARGLATAGLPLLVGSILLAVAALRGWRRFDATSQALLASALLYALPFTVVAPSAELRYLAWPMWAWLAAGLMALAATRRRDGDAVA